MSQRIVKLSSFIFAAIFTSAALLLVVSLLQRPNTSSKIHLTHEKISQKNKPSVVVNGNKATTTSTLTAQPGENLVYTSSTITPRTAANAGVLTWDQTGDTGVVAEIRTKNSPDAEWTKWTPLESDSFEKDGGPRKGTASALVLASNIAKYEFRFTLTASQSTPSSTVDLSKSTYTTINSKDGPTEKSASSGLVSAKPAGPNIIERSQWGCPEANNPEWPPEYATLTRAVIHHTASTESSDSYSDVRAIWQYHAKSLGWGDIGYNYIVDSKGRIFRGRYTDANYTRVHHKTVVGGHAYGANYGSVGISSIGNFENTTPTTAQVNSVAQITGYAMSDSEYDPSGTQSAGQNVVGHYQVGSTACPGANMKSRLDQIRNMAHNTYLTYRPYTFRPLGSISYMRITKDTTKMMTENGASIAGSELAAGRDIKMADYISRNGITYYRSLYDADANNDSGIKDSAITRIPVSNLPAPVPMILTQDANKMNPYTDEQSQRFMKGLQVKAVATVTINQIQYYQTEWDYSNGTSLFFPSTALQVYGRYEPFLEPRYLHVPSATQKINTDTMQPDESSLPVGDYKFTSKIATLTGVYYRTDTDSASGVSFAIPASATESITYQKLPTSYSWKQLATPSAKYYPAAEIPTSGVFGTDTAPIKFVDKIVINGKTYIRSQWDSERSNNASFPESALRDVTYISLVEPRAMKLTRAYTPINPITGESSQTPLQKDFTARYTTKVFIDGIWYLRSDEATQQQSPYAIPLDYLTNT